MKKITLKRQLEYQRTDQLSTRGYGRKPDFWVKMMNKTTGEKRKIGGAWLNSDDGSISINIDPFTVIYSSPDCIITLFPITRGVNTPNED